MDSKYFPQEKAKVLREELFVTFHRLYVDERDMMCDALNPNWCKRDDFIIKVSIPELVAEKTGEYGWKEYMAGENSFEIRTTDKRVANWVWKMATDGFTYEQIKAANEAREKAEKEAKKLTKEKVIKAFEENGWKDTVITCPDGAKAKVSPCSYVDVKSVTDCEYFLIYWDMPWGGEDNIDALVNTLNRHEELLKEQNKSVMEIHSYFNEHQANGWTDDAWDFYSDWHKDVFGFRPHGKVCGVYVRPY